MLPSAMQDDLNSYEVLGLEDGPAATQADINKVTSYTFCMLAH